MAFERNGYALSELPVWTEVQLSVIYESDRGRMNQAREGYTHVKAVIGLTPDPFRRRTAPNKSVELGELPGGPIDSVPIGFTKLHHFVGDRMIQPLDFEVFRK